MLEERWLVWPLSKFFVGTRRENVFFHILLFLVILSSLLLEVTDFFTSLCHWNTIGEKFDSSKPLYNLFWLKKQIYIDPSEIFFSLLLQRKIIRGCTWKEAWNDDTYLSFKCYLNCVFRARYWIWNLHVRVSMLCPCGMTNAALWSMYGIHMAEGGSKHSSLRCHTAWELNNNNTKLKLCKLKEKFCSFHIIFSTVFSTMRTRE